VQGALGAFPASFFYTDDVGPAWGAGKGAAAPIILSISNSWQPGKSQEEVTAVLKATQEAAVAFPGVVAFQYGLDPATRTSTLTEVYESADVVPKFQAAAGAGLGKLLSTISTTSLRVSGPKWGVDALKPTLAPFGAEFYYTDAVIPAFSGFGELGSSHVSLHLKFGLKPGKTLADFKKLYEKEVAVVSKQPGCLQFQCEVSEDSAKNKVALLSEKYASAAAHLATNVALAEAGLVEGPDGIFATYDFVELKFGLSQANLDAPGYKDLLSQFHQVTGHKPVTIVHDFGGKCFSGVGSGNSHIILTATCGLQPGKTMADMKRLYEREVLVANACDGVLHFQLEMSEDSIGTKTAVLNEIYKDWESHIALNVALAEAGLVEGPDGIFATYQFQHFQFGMIAKEYTEGYKGLLSQFEQASGHTPVVDIHNYPGKSMWK